MLLFFICFDWLIPAIQPCGQAENYWTALVPYSTPTQTSTFCTKACLQLALYLYYNCTGTSLEVWDNLYREPVLSPHYRLKNAPVGLQYRKFVLQHTDSYPTQHQSVITQRFAESDCLIRWCQDWLWLTFYPWYSATIIPAMMQEDAAT